MATFSGSENGIWPGKLLTSLLKTADLKIGALTAIDITFEIDRAVSLHAQYKEGFARILYLPVASKDCGQLLEDCGIPKEARYAIIRLAMDNAVTVSTQYYMQRNDLDALLPGLEELILTGSKRAPSAYSSTST